MYKVKLEYFIPSQNKVSAEILIFPKYNELEKHMISIGKYLKSDDKEYQIIHIDIDGGNKVSVSSIQGTTGTVISYRVDCDKELVWRAEICNLTEYFGPKMAGDLHICLV